MVAIIYSPTLDIEWKICIFIMLAFIEILMSRSQKLVTKLCAGQIWLILIGSWFCTKKSIKILLKPVLIIEIVYFLFEKQALIGLLQIIGLQNKNLTFIQKYESFFNKKITL